PRGIDAGRPGFALVAAHACRAAGSADRCAGQSGCRNCNGHRNRARFPAARRHGIRPVPAPHWLRMNSNALRCYLAFLLVLLAAMLFAAITSPAVQALL